MRIQGLIASVVAAIAGCSGESAPIAPAKTPAQVRAENPPYVPPERPDAPIWDNLSMGLFEKIDKQVDKYVADKARDVDGRPKLFMRELEFQEYLELPGTGDSPGLRLKLEAWQKEFPDSAYLPIIEAMIAQSAAWRARGRGFSSTVTPEGWKLFHERTADAWRILMESRQTSSRIPSWYAHAISTGLDSGESTDDLRELFDAGIARHPGYLPIYFSYMRNFSPRWGGSFREADEFILEQVAAPTNVDGEMLYARLYWVIDQAGGQEDSLFDESAMSWPRMRRGFEAMMKAYPDSEWNRANFASFACRARDATAYGLLRPKVQAVSFWNAAPEGISLDVCDARFLKPT
jgi:hypothetical protein